VHNNELHGLYFSSHIGVFI